MSPFFSRTCRDVNRFFHIFRRQTAGQALASETIALAQGHPDQQHIPEKLSDLPITAGNKVGDGRKMRPGIGRKRYEDDVLIAALGNNRLDTMPRE
jgi:hypothetical protein